MQTRRSAAFTKGRYRFYLPAGKGLRGYEDIQNRKDRKITDILRVLTARR